MITHDMSRGKIDAGGPSGRSRARKLEADIIQICAKIGANII